jgi:acylphosphatase
VQGVGFRFFVEESARREGIKGFVRNRADGAVEVVAEGDADAVGRLELAIRRGPTQSRVDDVETDFIDPSGQFSGFSIRS